VVASQLQSSVEPFPEGEVVGENVFAELLPSDFEVVGNRSRERSLEDLFAEEVKIFRSQTAMIFSVKLCVEYFGELTPQNLLWNDESLSVSWSKSVVPSDCRERLWLLISMNDDNNRKRQCPYIQHQIMANDNVRLEKHRELFVHDASVGRLLISSSDPFQLHVVEARRHFFRQIVEFHNLRVNCNFATISSELIEALHLNDLSFRYDAGGDRRTRDVLANRHGIPDQASHCWRESKQEKKGQKSVSSNLSMRKSINTITMTFSIGFLSLTHRLNCVIITNLVCVFITCGGCFSMTKELLIRFSRSSQHFA
jgi:hypothetical protein